MSTLVNGIKGARVSSLSGADSYRQALEDSHFMIGSLMTYQEEIRLVSARHIMLLQGCKPTVQKINMNERDFYILCYSAINVDLEEVMREAVFSFCRDYFQPNTLAARFDAFGKQQDNVWAISLDGQGTLICSTEKRFMKRFDAWMDKLTVDYSCYFSSGVSFSI